MINLEQLGSKLKRGLEGELERPEVDVVENDRLKAIIHIVSRSFEEMDEGTRQEKVWKRALHDLDQDEQEQIEFIFTDAPSEVER